MVAAQRINFLILLLLISLSFAQECTFIPPRGWEIAELKNPSPHVKIGFLAKGSSDFRPSVNLAIEEGVTVSLKEYVKAVKELQADDPTSSWRDLGSFPMASGNGRLIEITHFSPFGEVKILQAILVAQAKAYILTAAVLKEEFFKFQKEILSSFRTLTVVNDLFSQVSNPEKQQELRAFFEELGSKSQNLEWNELQERLVQHADLGAYWVFLMLQKGHSKIYPVDLRE